MINSVAELTVQFADIKNAADFHKACELLQESLEWQTKEFRGRVKNFLSKHGYISFCRGDKVEIVGNNSRTGAVVAHTDSGHIVVELDKGIQLEGEYISCMVIHPDNARLIDDV